MSKKISLTNRDPIIESQRWLCVSYLYPTMADGSKTNGFIKFRGAFSTMDEAKEHCQKLQKEDPDHDIYVTENFSWLPCRPPSNTDNIEEIYGNEELNDLIRANKENQLQAKKAMEEKIMNDKLKVKEEHNIDVDHDFKEPNESTNQPGPIGDLPTQEQLNSPKVNLSPSLSHEDSKKFKTQE